MERCFFITMHNTYIFSWIKYLPVLSLRRVRVAYPGHLAPVRGDASQNKADFFTLGSINKAVRQARCMTDEACGEQVEKTMYWLIELQIVKRCAIQIIFQAV